MQEVAGWRPHRAWVKGGDHVAQVRERGGRACVVVVQERRLAGEALEILARPRRVAIGHDALDAGGRRGEETLDENAAAFRQCEPQVVRLCAGR